MDVSKVKGNNTIKLIEERSETDGVWKEESNR